jgi:hypothetical protein
MRVREVRVRIPERVAARLARFVESQEASTLETFIEQRIAEMARALSTSEQQQPGSEPGDTTTLGGYL